MVDVTVVCVDVVDAFFLWLWLAVVFVCCFCLLFVVCGRCRHCFRLLPKTKSSYPEENVASSRAMKDQFLTLTLTQLWKQAHSIYQNNVRPKIDDRDGNGCNSSILQKSLG